MIGCRDRPTRAMVPANAPVLVERRGTLDTGGIRAASLIDVVDGAVGGDGAFERQASGGVVRAEVFRDVVFD